MKRERLVVSVLVLCLISLCASTGLCASTDGSAIVRMSELFSSQGMKPFDIGLVMEDTGSGDAAPMFWDMFPMEANFGDRNETTASFWDVYDSVMNLRLIRVAMDINSKPEYTLEFISDGDAQMRVELYGELNIVDISAKEAGADYVKIGRYVIIDRTPEERIFEGISTFLENMPK